MYNTMYYVLCTKYCSYDLTHNDSLKHTTSIWGNQGTAMLGNLHKVVSPVRTGSKLGIQAVWLQSPHPWGPHSSPTLISTCLSTKTEELVLLKYSSGHKPEAMFIIWFTNIPPPCLVPAAAAKSLQWCLTLCDPIEPTRLPHPWDSPGKNTGVRCHFLLQCMKVKSESEVTQSCPTLSDPVDGSLPGSSVHGSFQARVLEWVASAFSGLVPRLCLNGVWLLTHLGAFG